MYLTLLHHLKESLARYTQEEADKKKLPTKLGYSYIHTSSLADASLTNDNEAEPFASSRVDRAAREYFENSSVASYH
jgi:hypothetical protein